MRSGEIAELKERRGYASN